MGGLEGTVVLDLSSLLPGPYCTSLLRAMGAEVWKIERPGKGDHARSLPEFFARLNRGKRSVTLDLARAEGKAVFHRMARDAGVIVESFRPGVAARLGIDYAAVREVNPAIVYCSISGYGQDGPYCQRAAHDVNIQALCGALGGGGLPDPLLPLGDLTAGVLAALGIAGALLQTRATGAGSYLDVAMTDGVLDWVALARLVRAPSSGNETLDRATPHYGTFATRDGRSIAVGVVTEDHLWRNLCRVLEKPRWAGMDHPARLRAGEEMRAELQRVFRRRDQGEWLRLLTAADVPVTPVNSFAEALADPHLAHRRAVRPNGTVPGLGEHTTELLGRVGYDRAQVEELRCQGVI